MLEKRYDKQREQTIQKMWESQGVYRFDEHDTRPIFSIDTPPPTVSGKLHIGHIFSYTQAEMVARYKRMCGYSVYYPFGFDDNGLPTERLVERDLQCHAEEIPREAFVEKCMEISSLYEVEFQSLWESLGFSVDWSLSYRTISQSTWRISQREFLKLLRDGNAYAAHMPVLWCPHCRTSIAQAEVETHDEESQFHTLLFTLDVDEMTTSPGDITYLTACPTMETIDVEEITPTYLPVATTRPELLYGCVALFVHPENPKWQTYIGKFAFVPLFGHRIPILANLEADPEKGTGIVMCATFGDATDAVWYKTYTLPYRAVLEPNGSIASEVPLLSGMSIKVAREKTLGLLREEGLLTASQTITHQVGFHERCGTSTELLPSKQWYIRILERKKIWLEAADRIQWYPAHMKERYLAWVNGLKWDWCVSRQRHFGIPIPVWTCAECGTIVLPDDAMLPVDPKKMILKSHCPQCGSQTFVPETGVLDTWATSSLTPQINERSGELDVRKEGFLPMSMRTQAHEIIRTWTFYTIVRSMYITGDVPWYNIMLCGFVLAGKGEKISKSKNNSVQSPQELVNTRSADTVRYWAASARLGTDTVFMPGELDQSDRFLNKLWNAARFCSIHLEGFTPDAEAYQDRPGTDAWILAAITDTAQKAAASMDMYETGEARKLIDALFWHDFCDNWLELAKERLYKPDIYGDIATNAAKQTVFEALHAILKLYAPFVPYITEAIYQDLLHPLMTNGTPVSLHLQSWPFATEREITGEFQIKLKDTTMPMKASVPLLLQLGRLLDDALTEARRYKTTNGLSMKDRLPELVISTPKQLLSLMESCLPDIRSATGADEPIIREV